MPASKLLMDIGDRLRDRREEMGLTQKQAAKLLHISETYYGEIERGNKRISLERMLDARKEMDVDLTWLLTGKAITPFFMDDFYRRCPPDKEEIMDGLLKELGKLCQ